MLLSRIRPVDSSPAQRIDQNVAQNQLPKVEEFLARRDFIGALTLLEFQRSINQLKSLEAIAYCCFHLGDFRKALEEYKILLKSLENQQQNPSGSGSGDAKSGSGGGGENMGQIYLNIGACYFCMGHWPESLEATNKGPNCPMKTRLNFHLAHKMGDEETLLKIHQELEETLENQLSLASIHYLRGDYQNSIDIYKRILLDNSPDFNPNACKTEESPLEPLSAYLFDLLFTRCESQIPLVHKLVQQRDYLALNVYVALCYHRLEYFDVSQEVLAVYLQNFPDSAIAANLRACNTFRLFTGVAAEKELKPILNIMHHNEQKHTNLFSAYDLIKHNLVVFRFGEGALQFLPKLLDVIPEARLNLCIYYLHQDDLANASNLLKDVKAKSVPELILFAIVNVLLAQQTGNREFLAKAQGFYNRIGSSESEQDSVFGRLCMASAHFLSANFDHCALYLNSVRTHYFNDDTFNFNYAQAKAMLNQYGEAEELLTMIQNERIRNDFTYLQWLARCYIMNKKPKLAWELYERMDTSHESFQLLQIIANECYRMGQFYYAAKAFDLLEKYDATQENYEGKRGACVGVFQMILAGREPKESLPDIITFLRNSPKQNAEKILGVIKKWAKDNRINL